MQWRRWHFKTSNTFLAESTLHWRHCRSQDQQHPMHCNHIRWLSKPATSFELQAPCNWRRWSSQYQQHPLSCKYLATALLAIFKTGNTLFLKHVTVALLATSRPATHLHSNRALASLLISRRTTPFELQAPRPGVTAGLTTSKTP